MTWDEDRWRHGHDAWARLRAWRDGADGTGPDAVEALTDIGLVRHLLDQTELAAVQAARRRGSSWAEIATRLGITRQSAWERWKDVDEEPTSVTHLVDDAAVEMVRRAARDHRRRSSVKVPNVVGLTWEGAGLLLRRSGLIAVPADANIGPHPGPGLVTDQTPEAGAKMPPGTAVALWIGPGGGSAGVREPRRPSPSPLEAQARPEVA